MYRFLYPWERFGSFLVYITSSARHASNLRMLGRGADAAQARGLTNRNIDAELEAWRVERKT